MRADVWQPHYTSITANNDNATEVATDVISIALYSDLNLKPGFYSSVCVCVCLSARNC